MSIDSAIDLASVAATLTPPAPGDPAVQWRQSAACRREDPELFFPIGSVGAGAAEIQRAKAVCAGCPVRRPCLAFALATGQNYGVWGGYDEDERRPLHRQWRASHPADRPGPA